MSAGYEIYSLDWDRFHQFVAEPSEELLRSLSDGDDTESVKSRLAQPDWYAGLSEDDQEQFAGLILEACQSDLSPRVECDGVYWDVIDMIRSHHKGTTNPEIGYFGCRPYRFSGKARLELHSMHTPDEVKKLLEEVKAAEPTVMACDDEDVIEDFEELLPALQQVANDGRLLLIEIDA